MGFGCFLGVFCLFGVFYLFRKKTRSSNITFNESILFIFFFLKSFFGGLGLCLGFWGAFWVVFNGHSVVVLVMGFIQAKPKTSEYPHFQGSFSLP